MLNFGASKPTVKGGQGPPPAPLDLHLCSVEFLLFLCYCPHIKHFRDMNAILVKLVIRVIKKLLKPV